MEHSPLYPVFQKTLFSITFLLFSCISSTSYAWESEIDKSYKNVDYNLYAKTKEAGRLLDKWGGNSELLKEAAVLLVEVVQADPTFAPAYALLGKLVLNDGLIHSGKYEPESLESSKKLLLEALRLEPQYDYALSQMSYLKMYQKDYDSAEKYLVEAESTGTTYPYLKSVRAYFFYRKGMYEESMEVSLEGYNKYSSQSDVAFDYARDVLRATNMLDDSPEDSDYWYKKIIELDPSRAWSYGNYSGYLLFTKMDFDAAIEYGDKAVAIMNYGMARRYLATALYCKWAVLDDEPNMQQEALKYFERAESIDTDFKYLQKELFKYTFGDTYKTFRPIYFKLLNFHLKRKNAKQDLDEGLIQQHEYDLIISSPGR